MKVLFVALFAGGLSAFGMSHFSTAGLGQGGRWVLPLAAATVVSLMAAMVTVLAGNPRRARD